MTDLPALSTPATATPTTGISTDTRRLGSRANLEQAGEKFEAVFINMMLKSMRQAKLGDGLFDSKNSDTFRDMQDQRVAESMAAHQPIGIGKAMVDFLARQQQSSQGTPEAPAANDEGAAS